MMEGEISADNEMTVTLSLENAEGRLEDFRCVIDTGFSDYLSLPFEDIERFGLSYLESRPFILGDNQPVMFSIFTGRIYWDGKVREIPILAAEGTPLVGMRLLRGAVFFSDIRDGGKVFIRAF